MNDTEIKNELRNRGFEYELVFDNGGYCLTKQYQDKKIWYEIMVNRLGDVDLINHSNNEYKNVININMFKEMAEDLKFIINNLKEKKSEKNN